MKHRWHDEIVAWAGGAEIEYRDSSGNWVCAKAPYWHGDAELRIKPQPKEKKYLYGYITNNNGQVIFYDDEKRNENYICKIEVLDD